MNGQKLSELNTDSKQYLLTFLSFQHQINQYRLINRNYNHNFGNLYRSAIDGVKTLEYFINNINDEQFNESAINEIKSIYQQLKFKELYLLKLPIIINLIFNSVNSEQGTNNSVILMKELNILPTSMHQLFSQKIPKLTDIQSKYAKLLIASSQLIAQCIEMSNRNVFDFIDPHGFESDDETNQYVLNFYLNSTPDVSINVLKMIYEDCWNHLHQQNGSLIPSITSIFDQNEDNLVHLNTLINEYGLILWHPKMIQNYVFKDPVIESIAYDEIIGKIYNDLQLPFIMKSSLQLKFLIKLFETENISFFIDDSIEFSQWFECRIIDVVNYLYYNDDYINGNIIISYLKDNYRLQSFREPILRTIAIHRIHCSLFMYFMAGDKSKSINQIIQLIKQDVFTENYMIYLISKISAYDRNVRFQWKYFHALYNAVYRLKSNCDCCQILNKTVLFLASVVHEKY